MSKICIDNEGLEKYLTIGKSYDILVESNSLYEFICDLDQRMFAMTWRFR